MTLVRKKLCVVKMTRELNGKICQKSFSGRKRFRFFLCRELIDDFAYVLLGAGMVRERRVVESGGGGKLRRKR